MTNNIQNLIIHALSNSFNDASCQVWNQTVRAGIDFFVIIVIGTSNNMTYLKNHLV